MAESTLYPIFLRLDGRACLLVGGGAVALRKARELVSAGARLTVIAPEVHAEFEHMAAQGVLLLERRRYEPGDVAGSVVVIAATNDPEVNAAIAAEGRASGALVNVVDDPPHCDFYAGALVRRGPLCIAVSTGGRFPARAKVIRRELEEHYDSHIGDLIDALGALRDRVKDESDITPGCKREALDWLASDEAWYLMETKGSDDVWQRLRSIMYS